MMYSKVKWTYRFVLLTLCFVWLVGCATSKQRAIQFVVVSDGVADTGATVWERYVDAQIDHCRSLQLATEDDRRKCLGYAAESDKVAILFEALVVAQLAVKVKHQCEESKLPLASLDCASASQQDWAELERNLFSAYEQLLPYLLEAQQKLRKQ